MITFAAEVYKIQTLVDGGLRITLDIAEDEIATAAKLMECKRFGVLVDTTMVPQASEPAIPQQRVERDPRARNLKT